MTYQWKLPGLYGVDAQTAGEEMQRIYTQNGRLDPGDIVKESRRETAPLHSLFEWRDDIAAQRYREQQAREIIRAIVAVEPAEGLPQPVRAFVHVQQEYQPMEVVVKSPDKLEELRAAALRDLEAFRQKYQALSHLKEFRPVFRAIRSAPERREPPCPEI